MTDQPTLTQLKQDSRHRLLNQQELCQVLGIARSTLYRWEQRSLNDATLPDFPREIDGSVIRYDYQRVKAWVNQYTEKGAKG